jgi:hypothetical protein
MVIVSSPLVSEHSRLSCGGLQQHIRAAPATHLRHRTAKMPSVQSPVALSMRPNIWGAVMALGFMRQMACLVPSSVRAPASTSMMELLPAPLGPTSMMP